MHTHLPVIPDAGGNGSWQGMSEQTAMFLVAVCIRWGLRPANLQLTHAYTEFWDVTAFSAACLRGAPKHTNLCGT